MFAGGEVEYTGGPLLIGEAVTVRTSLGQVQAKSGRSGDFVLATFQVEVRDSAGTVRVSERQDVVYSDPRPSALTAPSGALPIVGRALLPVEGAYELRTDPTVLLRFSSLTANGHRIHYDLGYAVEVEKLPGLLVHGPLLNIALTRAACATAGRHDVVRVQHRNLNPLFCGQSARLEAVADESGATAQAIGPGDEATAVKGRVALMFSAEKEGSR